jgi:hypothetical protein
MMMVSELMIALWPQFEQWKFSVYSGSPSWEMASITPMPHLWQTRAVAVFGAVSLVILVMGLSSCGVNGFSDSKRGILPNNFRLAISG